MTVEQAKQIVKAKYPKAKCCSVWAGEDESGYDGHWHQMVRSQRNGQSLSDAFSINLKGAESQAWKQAAQRLIDIP